MFRGFFSQILIDLGELEGDYRVFHLKNDITQSILSISIATISMLGMLRTDAVLFAGRPDLFMELALYRAGFIVVSLVVMFAISKSNKEIIYSKHH